MNNFQALVLLNMVDGIGGVSFKKLITAFGQPCEIFQASMGELTSKSGISPLLARRITRAPAVIDYPKEIDEAEKLGIKIFTLFDEEYPEALKEIYDPPPVLYVKGDFLSFDQNSVAVVGSRGASFYGLSCARHFSSRLSSFGLTIVSGMARGIDTVSHRAALDAGGRTIAVLGSGLNRIYPPENETLFSQISENGAAVSQFALNTPPLARNFPIRNRIISGLSRGVLVVEASQRSGALITARFALEQGREIFAVPGKVSSETSFGTNQLIKQGARMVTEPEEILQELRYNLNLCPEAPDYGLARDSDADFQKSLSEKEKSVIKTLCDEPKYIDSISEEAGLDISDIMSILLQLELKGVIKQLPGKAFVKAG